MIIFGHIIDRNEIVGIGPLSATTSHTTLMFYLSFSVYAKSGIGTIQVRSEENFRPLRMNEISNNDDIAEMEKQLEWQLKYASIYYAIALGVGHDEEELDYINNFSNDCTKAKEKLVNIKNKINRVN